MPRCSGTAISRLTTTLRSWSFGPSERTDSLAHQKLRRAVDDVVLQFSDELVAEPLVQRARTWIERRDAQKDVRRLAENALLGELHQARAHAASARFRIDADAADVADERASHHQDDESEQPVAVRNDVDLLLRVLDDDQALIERASEGDPRVRRAHHLRASLRFRRGRERTDFLHAMMLSCFLRTFSATSIS